MCIDDYNKALDLCIVRRCKLPLFVILTVSVCLSLVPLRYLKEEFSELPSGENSLRSTTKSYWPSCVYINGERMLTVTLINEWLTF